MRGDVCQQTGGIAHGGLERLLGGAGEGALGRIGRALDRVRLAAGRRHLGLRQQQPGPGPDQVIGERRNPPLDRRRFATQVEDRVEVLLDQPGGPAHLPGGHRVPDRVIGQPVLLVPGGGVAVQLRDPAGLFGLQAGAQQVGEQVVVAPPAAYLVQGQHEQSCRLNLLQQRLAAGTAGDRVAQRAGQPFQHRGLQQEGAHLPALPLEHLLGQIIQHIPVAAGERRHEPGHIFLAPQRQAGQLQPSRPPLGAGRQRGHRRVGQISTGRLTQHGRCLVGGEPQLGGAQLSQLPASPQPRQGQRRIGAAGQHRVQPRRQMLQQEAHRRMHRLRADQMVVI